MAYTISVQEIVNNIAVAPTTTAPTLTLNYNATEVPGVGIQTLSVDNAGHLIVTLSNASTVDAGYVVGPQGEGSATVTIGTVTTGAAGSAATVTNVGTITEATLNFSIPQGIKGDTGNTGATGSTGATGATGPQGIQGIQGIQGETGLTGAKGDKGDTGTAGDSVTLTGGVATVNDLPAGGNTKGDYYIVAADGHGYVWTAQTAPYPLSFPSETSDPLFNGITANNNDYCLLIPESRYYRFDGTIWQASAYYSYTWSDIGTIRGEQGIQGVKGDTGDTGATGSQGIQGITGDTGPTGPQGIQGATGSQGIQGETGLTGSQGIQGIQGVKGDKGDTGDTGLTGATGSQGIQGIQGVKGDKGDNGVGVAAGGALGEVLVKTSSDDYITGWTALSTVATSGDYDDLSDKPTLSVDINRNGFLDQTSTTIAFNDTTKVFTLTPVGASWTYYRLGIKYVINTAKTVTLTTVDNTQYFIYLDSTDGTLTYSSTPWNLATGTAVPVAMVFYDSTQTPKYFLQDERHTVLIDRRLHYYEHSITGSRMKTVGALSGYTLNTDTDAAKTFGIAESVLIDEDIIQTLPELTDPDGTATDYVVAYRTAASTWHWVESAAPFKYNSSTNWIQWDSNGTMTDAINNRYVNSYVLFTNISGAARYMIVNGTGSYSSLALAQAEDPATFTFSNFVSAEFVIGYRLTWSTATGNTTLGKVRLAATPQRIAVGVINTSSTASAPSHGSLLNLLEDDHTQYALTTGASRVTITVASPTSGQVLKYDGTAWINDTDAGGTTINTLDDIGDVTITTPTSGQVLKWNGTAWTNQADAEGSGGTATDSFAPFLLAGM